MIAMKHAATDHAKHSGASFKADATSPSFRKVKPARLRPSYGNDETGVSFLRNYKLVASERPHGGQAKLLWEKKT